MTLLMKQQSNLSRLDLGEDYAFSLIDNENTGGLFSVMHYYMGPFSKGPTMHIHDTFDQVFIVTKGSPTFVVNDQSSKIDFGGIVIAPKGIPHNVINETQEEVSYIMILQPGGFENYFKAISSKLNKLNTSDLNDLLIKYGERPA